MNQPRADLDWLYRREPEVEATKIMPSFDVEQVPAPQAALTNDRAPRVHQLGPQGAFPPPNTQAGFPPPPTPGQDPSSPMRLPGPEPTASAKQKKRHPIRRTIISLVLAWVLFMIGTPLFAWFTGTTVPATPNGERPADQPGQTLLLAGADTFDPKDATAKARRTDTIMLLHLPTTGKPVLISLPRDSYVSIPGHSKNKLNAAFAFGGAPLLVQTVEQATGVRIDGFFLIGYDGLIAMVDAVGGIEVCLKKAVKDRFSQLDLPAGCQGINGKTALSYVRMRKQDPKGDLGRVERQREVIAKVAKKAIKAEHLLNPISYWTMNLAAGSALARGTDTSLGDGIALIRGFLSISVGGGYTLTVPVANANATTPAGSSVLWNEAKAQNLFAMIQAGNTTGVDQFVR